MEKDVEKEKREKEKEEGRKSRVITKKTNKERQVPTYVRKVCGHF